MVFLTYDEKYRQHGFYFHYEIWNEIPYIHKNFNSATIEVCE